MWNVETDNVGSNTRREVIRMHVFLRQEIVHESRTISGIRGLFCRHGLLKLSLYEGEEAKAVAQQMGWDFEVELEN